MRKEQCSVLMFWPGQH